jgi:hypothetical protein
MPGVDVLPGRQSLFERPASVPSQRHSPTSQAAARAYRPRAMTMRDAVLDFIRRRGDYGATDAELIAAFSKHSPNSIRPRRIDLCSEGLVYDSKMTRLTLYGKKAVVWRAR